MKTRFIYFVICLILANCQETQPELEYKYSDKPIVIDCNINHSKLFNEAIYNFETNLTDFYANENINLIKAYSLFLNQSSRNVINYNNISDQHALDIFEALKNVEGLWVTNNNELSFNYNHDIFRCIADNIQDKDLKTTFNALLSTNSMSMRMLKDALITKVSRLSNDKYLATYIALELYYAKLPNVDLTKKEQTSTDTKLKNDIDPHAGHNHD